MVGLQWFFLLIHIVAILATIPIAYTGSELKPIMRSGFYILH
jgi:hypothetical protein